LFQRIKHNKYAFYEKTLILLFFFISPFENEALATRDRCAGRESWGSLNKQLPFRFPNIKIEL
jgi:hypothetical protein